MSGSVLLAGGFAFLAVAVGVGVAAGAVSDRLSADRRKLLSRLRTLGTEPDPVAAAPEPAAAGGLHRLVARLGEWAVARTRNPLAGLRTELDQAGYAGPSAPLVYLGARIALMVLLTAGAGTAAVLLTKGKWKTVGLWAVAGGGLGYVLPSVHLSGRVKARQQAVRAALPDALDVMVMCVESGASVAAAVDCLADEFQTVHPLLGEHLLVVRHEMQLGQSAGEAFRGLADRTGLAEARDLAAILGQSEQYGTSIGKALRTHAEAARQERQLWCEGMAAKAAVKIMFPTLLCIFPAMFIVLLGPAAMQMTKMFAK